MNFLSNLNNSQTQIAKNVLLIKANNRTNFYVHYHYYQNKLHISNLLRSNYTNIFSETKHQTFHKICIRQNH